MLIAMLLTFPSSYVFEKGGNNIWGWMIAHVFIDSAILVDIGVRNFAEELHFDIFILLGLIGSTILTFPVTKLLLLEGERRTKGPSIKYSRNRFPIQ